MSRNPFLGGRGRPLVVGHRGVPRLHQENSLAGFRRAIAMGVPAVELDVRLTRDRRAVVLHDHALARLTGDPRDCDDVTWDELSRLRLGRTIAMGRGPDGAEVVMRYDREEPISLLAEVLAELGDRVAINIELKLDFPRFWGTAVGRVVAGDLAAAGAADRVIVTSFDPRKLVQVRRTLPTALTGFCFDDLMFDAVRPVLERLPVADVAGLPPLDGKDHARRALSRLLDLDVVGRVLGTRAVGAEHTLIGADTVARLHARGVAIGTHTLFPLGSEPHKPPSRLAERDDEARRLIELGVDWIETDDPERLLALVG